MYQDHRGDVVLPDAQDRARQTASLLLALMNYSDSKSGWPKSLSWGQCKARRRLSFGAEYIPLRP